MYRTRLEETLPEVRERVRSAALRAGRNPAEVRLVGVTKGHPLAAVEAALGLGLTDLGENRLEELERKAARVPPGRVRWHMIGRLQRRKAPGVRGVATLLHSLDSVRLGERLERTAQSGAGILPALVQVNTSGEETKGGFEPSELSAGLRLLLQFRTLRIEGLMTMAPLTEDQAAIRASFRRLRELRDRSLAEVPGFTGRELSMGMSNDFETAVEEGSTLLRLGTVLFGEREE